MSVVLIFELLMLVYSISTYLPTTLLAYPSTYLPIDLPIYLSIKLPTYLQSNLPIYLPAYPYVRP